MGGALVDTMGLIRTQQVVANTLVVVLTLENGQWLMGLFNASPILRT